MRSDLVPLTSDLPARAAVGRPSQAPDVRGVGDVKRSGEWAVAAESSFRTWFGNIKLDLRQAQIGAAETHIHARALFGNIDPWIGAARAWPPLLHGCSSEASADRAPADAW